MSSNVTRADAKRDEEEDSHFVINPINVLSIAPILLGATSLKLEGFLVGSNLERLASCLAACSATSEVVHQVGGSECLELEHVVVKCCTFVDIALT